MSRIAAIFMFLAWLLYGTMPAVAAPLTPPTVERAEPAAHDHVHHRHDGKRDHGKMVEAANAEHLQGDVQQPCPHGGKTCTAPFCAACLTLLPKHSIVDNSPFVHAYPARAAAEALVSSDLAPLTPPPRT